MPLQGAWMFGFVMGSIAWFLAWVGDEGLGAFLEVGVSLAGAEFGTQRPEFSNRSPGIPERDYHYESAESIERLAKAGVRVFRVPFRWERIQPELLQPLDRAELSRLRQLVRRCGDGGARVILDLHNDARYVDHDESGPRVRVLGLDLHEEHLVDVWTRLSRVFEKDRAILAYGLLNEPHGLRENVWRDTSRAVVRALRSRGDRHWLLVCGLHWASAERFARVNGETAWIEDPLKRTIYEAHLYLDHDASGRYEWSHAEEARRDPGLARRARQRIEPFLKWLERNEVPGYLGEIGVPPDPGWIPLHREVLERCRDAGVGFCLWAAGEWWGDYPLSVQPREGEPLPESLRRAREILSSRRAR